jgi:diacylglycerol kinase (ATP)
MINKLFNNFFNSINGLKIALTENSFILELIGGIFLIPYLIFLDISIEFKLLILSIYLLLLAFEVFNTSVEKLCNKITARKDKDIKAIKDLASCSVFIVLLILVLLIIYTLFFK